MRLLWLCAGKPFDVLVPGAAIIDGSAAGEADKIADAARVGDQAAELAIGDLAPLDGADRFLNALCRERHPGATELVAFDVLEIAVGKIIGLPTRNEVGVVALDLNLHQRLHDL